MKMFLTRIGFGSKVIITGDASQKDLPRDAVSGLDDCMKVLKKIEDIGFCSLPARMLCATLLFSRLYRHTTNMRKNRSRRSPYSPPQSGEKIMTIQIDYETEKKLDIDYTQLANRVAHKILETEQCPYEASVNLVITDNEEIKEVNAQFRNINAPTDVLSFPMIPFPSPADYSIIEDQDEYFDLDTDELLLGDVMISVDRVYAQAEEYGHSTEREFSFLFAHSMFHLLGYDHMEPEEAAVMGKETVRGSGNPWNQQIKQIGETDNNELPGIIKR